MSRVSLVVLIGLMLLICVGRLGGVTIVCMLRALSRTSDCLPPLTIHYLVGSLVRVVEVQTMILRVRRVLKILHLMPLSLSLGHGLNSLLRRVFLRNFGAQFLRFRII